MKRRVVVSAASVAALLLAALATLRPSGPQEAPARTLGLADAGTEAVSAPADRTRRLARSGAPGAGEARAPRPSSDGPPSEDPEVLAEWFQEQVLEELARSGAVPQPVPSRSAPDAAVDWDYVEAVFDGRVSGIPDERKAGLSLQELDALGDIPYVEQLRDEKRFEELRELGFEDETVPWPNCLRTGTCRLDRASSPPD